MSKSRIASIDILRGIVMVIMALATTMATSPILAALVRRNPEATLAGV
jgi:uncharacterized membrane protein